MLSLPKRVKKETTDNAMWKEAVTRQKAKKSAQ